MGSTDRQECVAFLPYIPGIASLNVERVDQPVPNLR
jgi:hypothetical protein